jgi:hypothetical protein
MARIRTPLPVLTFVFALLAIVPAAAAASPFSQLRGHIGFGYTKLFATIGVEDPGAVPPETIEAPGGSMEVAAGLDVPIDTHLRVGFEAGIDLLGSTATERGSLLGELDYSVFELLGLVHYAPSWGGPVGRISLGPGLFKARADLSSSGAAAFEDLPVREWAPGVAGSVTFMSRKETKVSAGLELGGRYLFMDSAEDDWIIASARVVIHY